MQEKVKNVDLKRNVQDITAAGAEGKDALMGYYEKAKGVYQKVKETITPGDGGAGAS